MSLSYPMPWMWSMQQSQWKGGKGWTNENYFVSSNYILNQGFKCSQYQFILQISHQILEVLDAWCMIYQIISSDILFISSDTANIADTVGR